MSFRCLSAVPKNSARLGRALSLRSAGGQWKLTYLSSVFFNLFCARRYLTIAIKTLQCHWPEYLMEAGELAVFMISACAFGVILEHPASPVHQAIPNPFLRRALMGLAMGDDRHRHHLLSLGQTIRCAPQSINHLDFFPPGKNSAVGYALLRCRAIHRWYGRCASGVRADRSPARRSGGALRRDRARITRRGRFHRRGFNLFHANADGVACFEQA